MYFKNREQAGVFLANTLFEKFKKRKPIVVAIPRGGVPVAQPIAYLLDSPLTIISARKVGSPSNQEYGIGAVSEDGQVWMDYQELGELKIDQTKIDQSVDRAMKELKRQSEVFKKVLRPIEFKGRSVILVDDGLATGATMLAAIRSLKAKGVKEITVAVPVASESGIDLVRAEVNDVVSAYTPTYFTAVGKWYEDFSQVEDKEVLRLLEMANNPPIKDYFTQDVEIEVEGVKLMGTLTLPKNNKAWIIFAHGSGTSRNSKKNIELAAKFNEAGFGTLLFDLLTEDEGRFRATVFDVDFLAHRLSMATRWLKRQEVWRQKPIGYFGASTGAAAALEACALFEPDIFAVVSKSGRPDLAKSLKRVNTPTLLIVSEKDKQEIELNEYARKLIPQAKLHIIPDDLEQVLGESKDWFQSVLNRFRKDHHVDA